MRRPLLFVGWNLVAVLALILLLEATAGVFVQAPAGHIVDSWRFNHTWRPGGRFEHREWAELNPEYSEPYTHVYNRQGWLETYDLDAAKSDDTFRIFYVGDSFVEGTVPMDQSVPSRVERALRDRARAAGRQVEVINTGTPSYSPLVEYVLIRYKILDYRPDLVVLVVDMTDDFDDWKYRQSALWDARGNPRAVPPRGAFLGEWVDTREGAKRATAIRRVQLFLYRYSNIYNLLLGRRGGGRSDAFQEQTDDRHGYPRWAWCEEDWSADTARNVERMFDILRRIAALCRERGVRLVLTAVPHYPQFAADIQGGLPPAWSDRPHRELAALALDLGVPYLDAFTALRPVVEGTPQEAYYYRLDMHFNPRGYELWAAAHIEFLLDPEVAVLPPELYR